jgi:hypothetical protein
VTAEKKTKRKNIVIAFVLLARESQGMKLLRQQQLRQRQTSVDEKHDEKRRGS